MKSKWRIAICCWLACLPVTMVATAARAEPSPTLQQQLEAGVPANLQYNTLLEAGVWPHVQEAVDEVREQLGPGIPVMPAILIEGAAACVSHLYADAYFRRNLDCLDESLALVRQLFHPDANLSVGPKTPIYSYTGVDVVPRGRLVLPESTPPLPKRCARDPLPRAQARLLECTANFQNWAVALAYGLDSPSREFDDEGEAPISREIEPPSLMPLTTPQERDIESRMVQIYSERLKHEGYPVPMRLLRALASCQNVVAFKNLIDLEANEKVSDYLLLFSTEAFNEKSSAPISTINLYFVPWLADPEVVEQRHGYYCIVDQRDYAVYAFSRTEKPVGRNLPEQLLPPQ